MIKQKLKTVLRSISKCKLFNKSLFVLSVFWHIWFTRMQQH